MGAATLTTWRGEEDVEMMRLALHNARTPGLQLAVLTIACAAAACSPGARVPYTSNGRRTGDLVHRASERISPAELRETREPTVLEALRRLRADLFRARAPSPSEPQGSLPAVYIDGMYQGDLSALQSVIPDVVREIRVVSSIDAAFRFGRPHPAGAVLVLLKLR
jgi:hypothetical protein